MAEKDTSSLDPSPPLRSNQEIELKINPPEAEVLASDLEWDGPDDPDNSRNWPQWQRILHTAIPAVWSFGLYAATPLLPSFLPFEPVLLAC